MRITVKMFADLVDYLPQDAQDYAIELTKDRITISDVFEHFCTPAAAAELMMLNGVQVAVDRYPNQSHDQDTVLFWSVMTGG